MKAIKVLVVSNLFFYVEEMFCSATYRQTECLSTLPAHITLSFSSLEGAEVSTQAIFVE